MDNVGNNLSDFFENTAGGGFGMVTERVGYASDCAVAQPPENTR